MKLTALSLAIAAALAAQISAATPAHAFQGRCHAVRIVNGVLVHVCPPLPTATPHAVKALNVLVPNTGGA